MAYDSGRQRVVMFGGEAGGGAVLSDTWEFSGATSTWTQRTMAGPSGRRNAVLVYDPTRQVTVLFGGQDGNAVDNNQTWEWNGTAWSQRTPTSSPSARAGAAGAWDPVRQRVVIFGGRAGAAASFNDVSEYDGTTWTARTGLGTAPSARSGSTLVYDEARARLVMSCGRPEGTTCDTWEIVGGVWLKATATTTTRYLAPAAYHPARGRTEMVGGATTAPGSTVFGASEFDGTAWTSVTPAPTQRGYGAMAYDSTRGKAVLFGGYGAAYLSDTWEY